MCDWLRRREFTQKPDHFQFLTESKKSKSGGMAYYVTVCNLVVNLKSLLKASLKDKLGTLWLLKIGR